MKKIIALLLLFSPMICYSENEKIFLLSCDAEKQDKTPLHFDYIVNLEDKKVNGFPANINELNIIFTASKSGGNIFTTEISRISGTILVSSKVHGLIASGTCKKTDKRQF